MGQQQTSSTTTKIAKVNIGRAETPSDKLFLYTREFSFFEQGCSHNDRNDTPSELNTNNQVFWEKLNMDLVWFIMSFFDLDDLLTLSHTSSNFRNHWFKHEEFLKQCKSRPDLIHRLLFISPRQDNLLVEMKYCDLFCNKLTNVTTIKTDLDSYRELSIGVLGGKQCGKTTFTLAKQFPRLSQLHLKSSQVDLNHLVHPTIDLFTDTNNLKQCKGLICCLDLSNENSLNELEALFDEAMTVLYHKSYERNRAAELVHSGRANLCSICIMGTKSDLPSKISADRIATFMKGLGCTEMKMHELRIQYFEYNTLQDSHLPIFWIASHLSLQKDMTRLEVRAPLAKK